MSNQKYSFNLKFELLFFLLAAVLAAILIMPIIRADIGFPFLIKNITVIVLAVLLFKHVFFLKYTWLNNFQKIKIALIPLSIPLIVFLFRLLNGFTTYIDEIPLGDLMQDIPFEEQRTLSNYIRIEYVTMSVMAIIAALIFPFRLLVNIWREVNRR